MTVLFNQKVYRALSKIPRGRVTTYAQIAKAIGHPKAYRAVGGACNKNPNAPAVPCHRVVKSDGSLGGYAHGKRRKIALLKKEGIAVQDGKVVDFEEKRVHARQLRGN
ncbi:MAG: MGMT family protein [Candidatus Diapherotrites archaeon]|nr:MGMT family protein [Candidatus Diapherotrites archaeon]